jgi:cytochrome P450/NADPH-cytochrome P450 reductase
VPGPLVPLLLRRASRRNAADIARLNRIVDEVVRTRRAEGGGDGDLLDRMLDTAHPETGERLSAENVRRQVITFLVAGHETTSGALSFALHYLSLNPDIAARARAEVDQVWGDAAVPRYDQVARLRYVRRVLDESLRLWPTAPAFAREARADTVLGGEHPMRRGGWALVLTAMLHRDPEVWGPDAERFDPDRFDAQAVRARAPHTFKPFGTGARACSGRQFALHEATLVLGLLLRRYELRPDPAYEDIGRLTYTRQVLSEALRLWPTAATFGRHAREDTVLGGRLPLRAGQAVSVFAPMLHRQPVWGDNPELFDPSRFTPEAEAARPVHAYKPFGTGERACIGRQFALHEATMLLAMLVHRYRLHDHADYALTVKETLTLKPEGFTLALTRRTGADRIHAPLPGAATAPAGTGAPDPGALPSRVRPGTAALFLHGSNYGTCRDFAAGLADEAAAVGCATEVAALDSYAGGMPTDRPVIITAASYNGRPTDDATAFTAWLDGTPDLTGVTYAVLGVGDRTWAATYQHVPTRIDARLAELGATRLTDRAAADASGDLTGTVRAFTAGLRTRLLQEYGDPDAVHQREPRDRPTAAYEVRAVTGGPLDALARRHELVAMTVTEARDLTAPGHPRTKRFLRIALPAGVTYRTADHLTVLPVNAPDLVDRAAVALGVDQDTVLDIRATRPRCDEVAVDRPLTIRQLLIHHVELQERPTARQKELLAAANPCPPERAALSALAGDDPRTLLEIAVGHPALRGALDWPRLLELLTPLRPRHYSISSSPALDPGHADLMVSVLDAPARSGNGRYRGTGSGHLAGLRPGDTVYARVQPCRDAFRSDGSTPVVMVAAGTGLAPFRGAVADRTAAIARGDRLPPALLYFGCDAPDADFLHAGELWAAEADEVWRLLGAGARVYVCGDGARMAPGVREAFRTLYRERTPGADAAAAGRWLDALVADGRYVEDVYAAG